MSTKNEEIISSFITSTSGWLKNMERMEQEQCMVCGLIPKKIRDLRNAIEEENEKSLKIFDWLTGPDTGISSESLCRHMLGFKNHHYCFMAPSDAGDRGRCIKLLNIVPEWIERLNEMEIYKGWKDQIPLIKKELEIFNKNK